MNCKPGDLAIVVRASLTPEMLGRIVTVTRLAVPGERFKTDIGRMRWEGNNTKTWVIKSDRLMPWYSDKGALHFATERVFHDDGLRPINPGDLVEDDEQGKKLVSPV